MCGRTARTVRREGGLTEFSLPLSILQNPSDAHLAMQAPECVAQPAAHAAALLPQDVLDRCENGGFVRSVCEEPQQEVQPQMATGVRIDWAGLDVESKGVQRGGQWSAARRDICFIEDRRGQPAVHGECVPPVRRPGITLLARMDAAAERPVAASGPGRSSSQHHARAALRVVSSPREECQQLVSDGMPVPRDGRIPPIAFTR